MAEAPQCNRMTATGQDTDNKIIIYNTAVGAGRGDRGHGHKHHLPWPPELLAPPWPPELPAPPWPPELPAPPWPPLSVPLWRSPSCVPVRVCPEGPTPPPRWNCYGMGHAFREGGVMSGFCRVSCVPASCFLIWFASCPCFMWLLVNSCPAVFVSLSMIIPVYL